MATKEQLKALLEAGAHFGHQTRRWNPKMNKYIYGARGGIHIIDLTKTGPQLDEAKDFVRQVAENGGSVMFVGTKRQASPIVKKAAENAGMPYVSERWLGGMLTNWQTIFGQIKRLRQLEEKFESGELEQKYTKKELLGLQEEVEKLQHIFDGVKALDEPPQALFVIDVVREDIAVAEANKLGIPVVAITDTNADPDTIDYPIAANDDAIKSIRLITEQISAAAAEGAAAHRSASAEARESEDTEKADKPKKKTTTKKA